MQTCLERNLRASVLCDYETGHGHPAEVISCKLYQIETINQCQFLNEDLIISKHCCFIYTTVLIFKNFTLCYFENIIPCGIIFIWNLTVDLYVIYNISIYSYVHIMIDW